MKKVLTFLMLLCMVCARAWAGSWSTQNQYTKVTGWNGKVIRMKAKWSDTTRPLVGSSGSVKTAVNEGDEASLFGLVSNPCYDGSYNMCLASDGMSKGIQYKNATLGTTVRPVVFYQSPNYSNSTYFWQCANITAAPTAGYSHATYAFNDQNATFNWYSEDGKSNGFDYVYNQGTQSKSNYTTDYVIEEVAGYTAWKVISPLGGTVTTSITTTAQGNNGVVVVNGDVTAASFTCATGYVVESIDEANKTVTIGKFIPEQVYRIHLRDGATGNEQNYHFFYDAASGKIKTRINTNVDAFVRERLFYFKKSGNGYTLHCIATGDDKGLEVAGYTDGTKGTITNTPTVFTLVTNTNGGFSLRHPGNENGKSHLNDIGGELGVWTPTDGTSSQNDKGSNFTVELITESDIEGVTSANDEDKNAAKANHSAENIYQLFSNEPPTFTAQSPANITSGWYQIKWVDVDSDSATGMVTSGIDGKYVKSHSTDVTVNGANYPFYLDTNNDAPANMDAAAEGFVYVSRTGSGVGAVSNIRSANGHYAGVNGQANTAAQNLYIIYKSSSTYPVNSVVCSGTSGSTRTSWTPYETDGVKYIRSGNTDKYPMVQFSPVSLENLGLVPYTVTIAGGAANAQVTYTGNKNYGIDKVYNNGTLFFGANTTVELSDFTAPEGYIISGESTIENNTINIVLDAPYITELSQLSNTRAYTITSYRRGNWTAYGDNNYIYQTNGKNDSNVAFTSASNKTADASDPDQQWAILKSEKNNYYLYNVSKKKFFTYADNYSSRYSIANLATEPNSSALVLTNSNTNYVTSKSWYTADNSLQWNIGMKNGSTNYLFAITNWAGGNSQNWRVFQNNNDLSNGDEGMYFKIVPVEGTFDFAEALQKIHEFEFPPITYTFSADGKPNCIHISVNGGEEIDGTWLDGIPVVVDHELSNSEITITTDDGYVVDYTVDNTHHQVNFTFTQIFVPIENDGNLETAKKYVIKNGDAYYPKYDNGNIPGTQTRSEADKFVFVKHATNKGHYYIYSVGAQKYLTYTTTGNGSEQTTQTNSKVQLVEKATAKCWVFDAAGHITPEDGGNAGLNFMGGANRNMVLNLYLNADRNSTWQIIDAEKGSLACAVTMFSLPGAEYMHKLVPETNEVTVTDIELLDGLTGLELKRDRESVGNGYTYVHGFAPTEENVYHYNVCLSDGTKANITLTVSNFLQAPTPGMVWVSWNWFKNTINSENLYQTAQGLKSKGLFDAGYNTIVIDDAWGTGDRNTSLSGTHFYNNTLRVDTSKFPDMTAFVKSVNDLGIHVGIYSDASDHTCGNYQPGSLGVEQDHVNMFNSWGIDFLKYDYCGGSNHVKSYTDMGNAIANVNATRKAQGKSPFVFNACEWGKNRPWEWGAEAGTSMWRATSDAREDWLGNHDFPGVLAGSDEVREVWMYAGVNRFNDLDMMCIGLHGKGSPSNHTASHQKDGEQIAGLTTEQARSQMSIWSMFASPLSISCDVRETPDNPCNQSAGVDPLQDPDLAILKNADIIRVSQDPLGQQAEYMASLGTANTKYQATGVDVYVKDMVGGQKALAFVNRNANGTATPNAVDMAAIYLDNSKTYTVKEVWSGETFTVDPASHQINPGELAASQTKVYIISEIAPVELTSGYYYIKNAASNKYLVNNYDFSTTTTLSSSKVTANRGVWKIDVNDNGTIAIKNGISTPLYVGDGSYSTLTFGGSVVASGIYFTEGIDGSGESLSAGAANSPATRWVFDPIADDSKIVDVIINGDNGEGVVSFNMQKATNGGFFALAASEAMTAFSSNDIDGKEKNEIKHITVKPYYIDVEYYVYNDDAVDELQALIDEIVPNVESNEIGYPKSTNSEVSEALNNVLMCYYDKTLLTSGTDEVKQSRYTSALESARTIANNSEINLPTAGGFYTLTNAAGDVTKTYYIKEGSIGSLNQLVSYENGQFAKISNDFTSVGFSEIGTTSGEDFAFMAARTNEKGMPVNLGKVCVWQSGEGPLPSGDGNIYSGWTIKKLSSLPITVPGSGYSTFWSPVDVQLVDGLDLHAYTATVDNENANITFNELEDGRIPAGTGVLIAGIPSSTDVKNCVTPLNTVSESVESDLKGAEYTQSYALNNNAGYYSTLNGESIDWHAYTLQSGTWKRYTGSKLSGFKAHLELKDLTSSGDVRAYTFSFGESIVTSIDELFGNAQPKQVFDLSGRQVSKAQRGLYIVNGKKVLR